MAKPAWVTLSKTSGAGNGNVTISGTPHTGRVARTGSVVITNASGTKPAKTVNISQAAKELYATIVSTTPISLPATGGVVVVTLKSNAAKLLVSCLDNGIDGANSTCTVNSVAQTIDGAEGSCGVENIKGDPGAVAEHTAIINLKYFPNTTAKVKTFKTSVVVWDSAGEETKETFFTVTVAAAASTLSVTPESVSLVTAGTAQNIAVTSNDDWTIV